MGMGPAYYWQGVELRVYTAVKLIKLIRSYSCTAENDICPRNKVLVVKIINILPVVLYGCETWSLILREESRLRVFENRILRQIFVERATQ